MTRLTFKLGETIQIFRIGDTANEKIAEKNEKIVQTYTFSVKQFDYIANTIKPEMSEFFSFDYACCLDCPFSSNQGNSKCYTHKYMQYSGFVSMIRSIIKEFGSIENIPNYYNAWLVYGKKNIDKFFAMANGKYVRFGSYGEPTLHPTELVDMLALNASTYTGYTHQWNKQPEQHKYFMASTHSEAERKQANNAGYRAFVAVKKDNTENINAVFCMTDKFSCSKCALCSGTCGKGKRDIKIEQH